MEALVGVLVVRAVVVARHHEAALLGRRAIGALGTALPEGRRFGLIASGILGQHADNGGGAEEEVLEGDHDGSY